MFILNEHLQNYFYTDIMQQMVSLTKLNRTQMQTPPLWALGHHVCRNNSDQETSFHTDIKTLSNTDPAISNTTIPYDSDCIGQGFLKTAFGVNNNSYDHDEHAFEDLQKDFSVLNQ